MVTFGERLRFRRNRLGWTQDDLASKTGFSVSSITGWERGINPPNAQSLTKLAEVLSCDAGWLLIGSSPAGPDQAHPVLEENHPEFADDHVSPPWIRDLVARLCSLSPAFRERAVRQLHLTLNQMISGNFDSVYKRGKPAPDVDSSGEIVANRAVAAVGLARDEILSQRATAEAAQTTTEKGTAFGQPRHGKGRQ